MNEDKYKTAKAGTFLHIDSEDYADYSTVGYFLVSSDFQPMKELDLYFEKYPNERRDDDKGTGYFHKDKFIDFLFSKGFLTIVQFGNLHLYTNSDWIEFTPSGWIKFTPTKSQSLEP